MWRYTHAKGWPTRRRIDIAALQDGTTLPVNARWTSVTITTNSQPDEIMAVAASYDSTLQFGAQTPFSDQLSSAWEGGMWQYDAQHNSIIPAGNGGTKPTQAAFTIYYNQGTQRYDVEQTLQPDDQMWMNIGKLIREQTPDKNGKTLPANLTSGAFEFRDLSDPFIGSLFEGKVTFDTTYGHVTYGCSQCCAYDQPFLDFNPLSLAVGSGDFNSVGTYDCNARFVDVSQKFAGNWSTMDAGIATVDTNGGHMGVAVGTTSTSTHGYLLQWGSHKCPIVLCTPTGNDNVVPTVTVTCTLMEAVLGPTAPTNTTTGSCSTTTKPTGGSFTWSASKTTVNITPNSSSASYTAANPSTSRGDTTISVTYSVNGLSATAQSTAITVHKPTSLNVVSDSGSVQNVICNDMFPGLNYCGVHRDILYVVIDQLGTAMPIAGLPAVETFVPGANSCGISPPTPAGTQTLSNGNFGGPDVISLCTSACLPAQNCIPTGSCSMNLTQTWSLAGVPVRTNSLTIQCKSVTVVLQ